jgi:hypothetical protein
MGRRPADSDGGADAEEVAAYVAGMAQDLKGLVEPYRMRSLSYLLDLVRVEAEERARDGDGGQVFGPSAER